MKIIISADTDFYLKTAQQYVYYFISTKFRYGSNLKRNIRRSNIAIHMMTSAIFQHI